MLGCLSWSVVGRRHPVFSQYSLSSSFNSFERFLEVVFHSLPKDMKDIAVSSVGFSGRVRGVGDYLTTSLRLIYQL